MIPKEKYFVMHRQGWFKPQRPTGNQCKIKGHKSYHHDIYIAFKNTPQLLDKDKFIIDHIDIHNAVQKCGANGSCEEMHPIILKSIYNALKKKGIVNLWVGYRCVIKPSVGTPPMAHMQYWVVDRDHESVYHILN